jgi:hypothetical protein
MSNTKGNGSRNLAAIPPNEAGNGDGIDRVFHLKFEPFWRIVHGKKMCEIREDKIPFSRWNHGRFSVITWAYPRRNEDCSVMFRFISPEFVSVYEVDREDLNYVPNYGSHSVLLYFGLTCPVAVSNANRICNACKRNFDGKKHPIPDCSKCLVRKL